jgi:hypothetical protein
MALIIDPDNLSQGQSNTNSGGINIAVPGGNTAVTIVNASSTALPSFSVNDYFEIRNSLSANTNGLYYVTAVGTPTNGYTVNKVGGAQGSPTADARDDGLANAGITFLGADTNAFTEKSVYFDTYTKKIWLIRQGNLDDVGESQTNGVTLQSLYSFTKEEWKNDDLLIKFDFPFTAITPEQFEVGTGWRFYDENITDGTTNRKTRELVRTGGWSEVSEAGDLLQQYSGIITLGSFEDTADFAHVQFGTDPIDTTAADDFVFSGRVNEALRTFDIAYNTNLGGRPTVKFTANTIQIIGGTSNNWVTLGFNQGGSLRVTAANTAGNIQTSSVLITDIFTTTATNDTVSVTGAATYTTENADTVAEIAYDNRSALSLFLRANTAGPAATTQSKGFDSSDLSAIGVTTLTNQVYRFPLTNSLDPKISFSDDTLSTGSYPEIKIRYFAVPFQQDVDTAGSPRNFGIVIDAGTYSFPDGVYDTGSDANTITTAIAGIPSSTFDGGTLTIHEGADKGNYTVDTASGGTINILGAAPLSGGSLTNLSMTLQRSVKIIDATNGPTIEQIYNRVQYQLRQDTNINDTNSGNTVTGSTADELLFFVGDAITSGKITSPPENPEGGGTGVAILGFNPNDTNDVTLVDNGNTARNFPFLAAGNINFNSNLDDDNDAKFWMFFTYTHQRTLTNADVGSISGRTAVITCDAGAGNDIVLEDFTRYQDQTWSNAPAQDQLAVGQYIRFTGWTNSENNGIWRITTYTSATSITCVKVDGDAPVVETNTSNVLLQEDPIDSPDAIIVNDNNAAQIAGVANTASVAFDFDFTNNNQGSRVPSANTLLWPTVTTGNPAAVTVRAIGFNTAQFVEVSSTITRATGQSISVVSGLERNYSNPV